MQSENICRLCLLSNNNIIHFSSEEGLNLQISNILVQHFWFKNQQNDGLPQAICRLCWLNTKEFHEFYNSVEIAHERFKIKGIATNGDDFKTNNNCKIKCFDNNIEQNCNSTAETTQQLNEFNTLADPMDLEQLEIVVENTIKDENDKRCEIFNQPKFDIIEKEIIKDVNNKFRNKKSINLKNKLVNKSIKDQRKRNVNEETAAEKEVKLGENRQKSSKINLFKIDKIDIDDNCFNNNDNNVGGYNQEDQYKLFKPKIIAEQDKRTAASKKRHADDIKIKEFFNLNCHLCSVGHLTFTEVNTHFRIVHNLNQGYVICCKKKLFKRCELLEHMQWHLNPDEFKCSICNKLYSNRSSLKFHMNFHISPDNRNFSCDICGKRFSLKRQIKQHFTLTHIAHQNKIYKCNECDKCFGLNSALQSHVRGVHEFKNAHICHICAKVFKSKFKCDLHLSEHFNMEKLQCQICGSLLKNKSTLKKHVSRSHQAKPIECKDCGKISQNREALRSHMKYVHEALRLHKCNFCDKAFKKAVNLREHVAGHTGFVLYTCPYCPKTFNSNGNMHSHKRKSHLIEWQEDRIKRNEISKF